ncbi:MAG: SDR family oxidoreductase [Rhodothermales bacterium]|nr:SDR family oxidoreductase [Rhodothermales bacterium]
MSENPPEKNAFPPQHQADQPGDEHEMTPRPEYERPEYAGSGKLDGQAALITGGDSGIGRAVAVLFAREGADVAVVYFDEEEDAQTTKESVEAEGRRCLLIAADVQDEAACRRAVEEAVDAFGRLDVLVNNAAVQFPQESITDITEAQLTRTFRTNIFAHFFTTKAALPHLRDGGAIINTCSVTAFRGSPGLLDYASTKGAIVAFTRSLAKNKEILDKRIRVNSVAPGPVWTPLIPASFDEEEVASFGKDVPMERAAQPEEVAPAYVFLASADGSYVTGQTIHVNGGEVVGG